MDPDAALAEALDAARAILRDVDGLIQPETTIDYDAPQTLAERLLALHDWLHDGGMLPAAWHLSTCMASDCRLAEAQNGPGRSAAEIGGE